MTLYFQQTTPASEICIAAELRLHGSAIGLIPSLFLLLLLGHGGGTPKESLTTACKAGGEGWLGFVARLHPNGTVSALSFSVDALVAHVAAYCLRVAC